MTTFAASMLPSRSIASVIARFLVSLAQILSSAGVVVRTILLLVPGALVLSACGGTTDPDATQAVVRTAVARQATVLSGVNTVTSGRYVRLEATSEVNGHAWTSVAEFNVLDANGAVVPRTGWSVSADSQETVGENGNAINAIDGDPYSFWHTQWYGANPVPPHALTVDMKSVRNVGGFRYLPRQIGENGRIANWRFSTSGDGSTWTLVATGTFPNSADEQTVTFAVTAPTPNHPPVVSAIADRSDTVGQSVTQAIAAVDSDGDALTYAASGLPTGIVVDAASGLLTGTPSAAGPFAVSVQASDGKGGVASTAFTWTIVPVPVPPTTPAPPTTSGAVVARYVALEATTEVNGNPWTSVADFNLLGATGSLLPRTGWRTSADSQETVGENGSSSNAIDGDPYSFWHTQWSGANPPPPHRLTMDLGSTQSITAFRYLPRQLGQNGRIANWRFYASSDGNTWTLVSNGTFPNTADEQSVTVASSTTPTPPPTPTPPTTPTPTPTPVNQPPVVTTPSNRIDTAGQAVSLSVTASDPDGDPLAYAASNLPTGLGIGAGSGIISGTPTAAGTYNPTVQVSDGRGGSAQSSFTWTVSPPAPPTNSNAARSARIAAFASGPLVAGTSWIAFESVMYDTVRRLSSGQHVVYTANGTTGGTEPGSQSAIVDGRPIADGSTTAYLTGRTLAATQAGAPVVGSAASASAAGLIEADFAAGDFQAPRYSAVVGCKSLSTGFSFIGHYCFANGPASGSGNATSVASGQYGAGLSNANVYHANTWSEEFVVTDRMFGLVFANSSSAVNVEVDGVPVQAGPSISSGGQGWTLVFDYQGVVKRRTVRVVSATGSVAPVLRGIAMTAQGTVEAGVTSTDQVLILGDSINAAVVPISDAGAQMMSYWIERYLGFSGVINMAVGGSGYISENPGTYNIPDLLANPVNRSLLASYAPNITHVIIGAGFNDRGRSAGEVQAAALASWRAIRQLLPNAKISITDGWSGSSGPDANALSTAAALTAAFASWGDPNARLIHPVGTSAATAYVNGTGNAGSPITSGNSSMYTSVDGTHPSPAGARYLGRRIADDIVSAWGGAY